METMTIGKLAQAAGIGVETVRFYERRRLLEQPVAHGTYRQYPPSAVDRLRFIKRAQSIGFTLTEIKELLSLIDAPDADRSHVRQLAARKLQAIEEKIQGLQAMRSVLSGLVHQCDGRGPVPKCPIIQALVNSEQLDANCEKIE